MRFSKTEIRELIKAWFFISLAFAILFSGGLAGLFPISNFLVAFVISGLTVGISFIFHEIMHKSLAQKYGYFAEFRAFDKMLWLAVIMSLFGFIIAAPGAVMIRAFHISKERNGKISLAGPLSNIALAILFLLLLFFMSPLFISPTGLIQTFLSFGFRINSLLALFNMIPFGMFDGRKVLEWNKTVFGAVLALAVILYALSFYVS